MKPNANLPNQRNRRRNRNRNQNAAEFNLTGGTRDIKPQLLSFAASQTVADTTATTVQSIPVLRNFQSGPGRAQLVEILRVYAIFPNNVAVDSAITVLLGTKNFGATGQVPSEPSIFFASKFQFELVTSGATAVFHDRVWDLTDGAGNGILVATDNIFAQIISVTTGVANTVHFKILYRISGASVTEYVGIVQGQC
jgi:hypothetical protein